MAWTGNIAVGWIDFASNGKYTVSAYIYYRLNEEERKIYVVCTTMKVRSLTSINSYNWNTQIGYQLLGGAAGSEYGTMFDEVANINVPCGGEWQRIDAPVAMNYAYDSDGKLPVVRFALHLLMSVPGWDSNYYGFLNFDWREMDLSRFLPEIGKELKSPTSLSIDPNFTTTSQIKAQWVGNNKAVKYKVTIKGGNVDTTVETTNNYYIFKNLSPNTAYKISIYSVSSDDSISEAITLDTTTKNQAEMYINVNGESKKVI